MKKKLNVLINEQTGNDSYLAFLALQFDLNIVKFCDYTGKQELDLVLFTGGEDVYPEYYGERTGKHTSYNSKRDSIESNMFHYTKNIPKLGICRGSQFLTVMCGGKLIQHVEGHAIGGKHTIDIVYPFNQTVEITSTHHQMLYPFNLSKEDYVMCAYSTYNRSGVYLNGNNENISLPNDFVESEIVFYPNYKALAIQGHPESGVMSNDEKMFFLNYIQKLLKL